MARDKEYRSSFRTTFALVTRIKTRGAGVGEYKRTLFYLPVIGLIVSIIVFTLYAGLSFAIPDPFILILIVITVQYFLFNLFHLDGFLDTADAFSLFTDQERRLEILKDVRLGSFAFFAGAIYIAAKLYILTKSAVYFHILGSDPVSRYAVLFLFLTYPVTGRASAAFVPMFTGPAKREGLGSLLRGCTPVSAIFGVLGAYVPAFGMFIAAYFLYGYVSLLFLVSAAGSLPAACTAGLLYRKRAGGYTGDAFGFAVELGELAHITIFYMFLIYGRG